VLPLPLDLGDVVRAFRKLFAWGWDREPRPSRALGIAGTHATVLTILIGITSAYYIFTQDKIYEMEMQALREAEKINQVEFVRAYYYPKSEEFLKYDDPKNVEQSMKLIVFLIMLFSDSTQAPGMEIPKMPADRAEKALQIMNFLVHRYPFPESVSLSSTGVSFFPPKPLLFKDRVAIAKWSEDLDRVISSMIMWPGVLNKTIDQYLLALKSRDEKLLTQWKTDHFLQVQGFVDPYFVFNDYVQNFRKAYDINRSVKLYLDKASLLEKRFVTKKQMLMVIGSTFLAFFCGVVLPLFAGRVRRVFLLWIPCGFYVFVFSFLVYRLLV
jgi:hypothetical protein